MNWKSHKPCPYEDCGSTDAFSYNLDSMSGRCHSCERKYPRDKAAKGHPLQEKDDWDMEPAIKAVPTEVLTGVYRTIRSISDQTMRKYDCKTYLDKDGKEVKQEYIYPSGGVKTHSV